MKIKQANIGLGSLATDLLVLTVKAEDLRAKQKKGRKSAKARAGNLFALLNEESGGALIQRLKKIEFDPAKFASEALAYAAHPRFKNLLLVSLGKEERDPYNELNRFRRLGSLIIAEAKRQRAASVTLDSTNLASDSDNATALLEGLLLANYTFDRYKSEAAEKEKEQYPSEVTISPGKGFSRGLIENTEAVCAAVFLARDLINTPPRDCPPRELVKTAKAIASQGKLSIEVFDRPKLTKMGANALLAVAQGSEEPPYLIRLVYKPKGKSKRRIALVGKGVTFDSGGLSIKTASGMESMKCDMSGAAAVLGTMQALAQLKAKVEVRAYIPTTENMINGLATRPGDVVTAMSGKTVEILNTDAEGRLILADALNLAEQDKCQTIIDLATLTGACMVALGTDYAGLFANNEDLAESLLTASAYAGERLWRMPLAPEYRDWIKSSVADIKNVGKSYGGAITAALFLKEFVKDAKWAHLDIAGPAFAEGDAGYIRKGGVGFGVRTLVRYLQSQR